MRTAPRERRTNAERLGTVRDRIDRNIEYHQQVAEHYNKLMEDSEEGQERSEAAQVEHERSMEDAKAIAEMHGEAAKMLADAMGTATTPVIEEEKANRPVIRRLN